MAVLPDSVTLPETLTVEANSAKLLVEIVDGYISSLNVAVIASFTEMFV